MAVVGRQRSSKEGDRRGGSCLPTGGFRGPNQSETGAGEKETGMLEVLEVSEDEEEELDYLEPVY